MELRQCVGSQELPHSLNAFGVQTSELAMLDARSELTVGVERHLSNGGGPAPVVWRCKITAEVLTCPSSRTICTRPDGLLMWSLRALLLDAHD